MHHHVHSFNGTPESIYNIHKGRQDAYYQKMQETVSKCQYNAFRPISDHSSPMTQTVVWSDRDHI